MLPVELRNQNTKQLVYPLRGEQTRNGWEKESGKGLFSLDKYILNSFFIEIMMSRVNSVEQRKLFHAGLEKE